MIKLPTVPKRKRRVAAVKHASKIMRAKRRYAAAVKRARRVRHA